MTDDVDVTKEDLTDKQIKLLEMIREEPEMARLMVLTITDSDRFTQEEEFGLEGTNRLNI